MIKKRNSKKGDVFSKKITVLKWQLNFFGLVTLFVGMVIGFFLTFSNIIFPVFATDQTSVIKQTDTDFNQGTLSDVEISGSGNGALVQLEGGGGVDWYDGSWQYRKKITVDKDEVDEDLTDFPILISIDSDSDLAAYAQNDFEDILFADTSRNKLDHEIEEFDESTGKLVAWVEVGSLSSSTDTEIYLYYGNGSCSSQENVTGVWDDDFLGVWHLNETPSNNGTYYDSTGNSNDGTWQDADGSGDSDVDGKIEGANEFALNDKIATSMNTALNDFSVELWFKDDGVRSSYERLADKSYTSCFWLGRNSSTANSWGGGVRETGSPYGVFVTLSDGDWHQIASIRDGTTHYVYGDGGSVSNSNTVSSNACDSTTLGIGAWGNVGSTSQRFGA